MRRARIDGRVEDEGWRVRKDGSRFWADALLTALYDARGGLRGYAKVTRGPCQGKMCESACVELCTLRIGESAAPSAKTEPVKPEAAKKDTGAQPRIPPEG